MCLCNDDLAHVINQSAIISFFFSFCFFSSKLGTRFESLAKQSPRSPYVFSFSFFHLLFHISFRSILFIFWHTSKGKQLHIYLARIHVSLRFDYSKCATLSLSLFHFPRTLPDSSFRSLCTVFPSWIPVRLYFVSFIHAHTRKHTHTNTHARKYTRAYTNIQAHIRTHEHSLSLFFSLSLSLVFLFVFFFFTLLLNRYRKICRWESSRGRPKSRSSLFFSFISPRALQTRELKGSFFILYSLFFSFLFFLPLIPRPAGSRARALQYPIKTKLFLSWLPCVTVKVGRPTRIVVDHTPPSSSKRADPRSIDRKFQPSNHFLSLYEPLSSLLSTPRIAVPAFLIGIF